MNWEESKRERMCWSRARLFSVRSSGEGEGGRRGKGERGGEVKNYVS